MLLRLFACILLLVSFASFASQKSNTVIDVTYVQILTEDFAGDRLFNELVAEFSVWHPQYRFLGFESEKTKVHGVYDSRNINLTKLADEIKRKKGRSGHSIKVCHGSLCGKGFTSFQLKDEKMHLTFVYEDLPIKKIENFRIIADLQTYVVKKEAKEKQAKLSNVLLTDKQSVSNDLLSFTLEKEGTTINGKRGFYVRSPGLVITGFDLFSDDGGQVDSITVDGKNTAFIDKNYLKKPFDIVVYYYKPKLVNLRVDKQLFTP